MTAKSVDLSLPPGGGAYPCPSISRWRYRQPAEQRNQLAADRRFADKAIGKRPERVHDSGNRVRGQEDDTRFGRHSPYFDRCPHAIHHGHIDIEDYDLRLQRRNFLYRFFSIRSLAAYVERMLLEKRPNGRSHHCDVVNQKYSSPHRHL